MKKLKIGKFDSVLRNRYGDRGENSVIILSIQILQGNVATHFGEVGNFYDFMKCFRRKLQLKV